MEEYHTHSHVVDENIKAVQESHYLLRLDIDSLTSPVDDQKKILQGVLARLSSLLAQK
ncbi:hypothetical protein PVK06_009361 [Gossypium arboreum]|uniref:Uncharacterized protein n=1 Tax=Gossypium arboreum TaxID=29729 RepID=A0ABR0QM79_GOSAR|nr:hypothetical protein PVK06_009361 [Gossypium arboreum]